MLFHCIWKNSYQAQLFANRLESHPALRVDGSVKQLNFELNLHYPCQAKVMALRVVNDGGSGAELFPNYRFGRSYTLIYLRIGRLMLASVKIHRK